STSKNPVNAVVAASPRPWPAPCWDKNRLPHTEIPRGAGFVQPRVFLCGDGPVPAIPEGKEDAMSEWGTKRARGRQRASLSPWSMGKAPEPTNEPTGTILLRRISDPQAAKRGRLWVMGFDLEDFDPLFSPRQSKGPTVRRFL